MATTGGFEVIRDPLWNNIRIDTAALGVVDSEPFQRLRYIRQLGHAYLVYPGATHTRFEHALGAYHLARRTLGLLAERGELDGVPPEEVRLVPLAALLHDIGHYPFSHALEEASLPSHESLASEHFRHPELRSALATLGIESVETRLADLISGASSSPLAGLISGSLDLDKIEYLTRDARMCGVPYGTVDVDRLLHSISVVTQPDGSLTVGVQEKGVSALESLLFAKYQMYRNIYWHHAVRSATVMFKRLVRSAIASGHLDPSWIPHSTDEALMEVIRQFPATRLAERLRRRQLYKRAVDLPAREVATGGGAWIASSPDLVQRVEDQLAGELGLRPGELLLDFPAKPEMLAVDIPLRLRGGRTEQLSGERSDVLSIQRVAEELHTSARRLRVFVAEPVQLPHDPVVALAERSEQDVAAGLETGAAFLTTTA
ncbi:MAG: HD domain-containing protein [Gemmatimonadales bacterium]|nr:HD domain-containing protein [Gemmatimonadales bacterium]NIN50687.1 HD domain-containing protein [Gemmatimonadales bacterium]NIP08151.1 HD domain-containing protein [Gemmatimonadales bacterium]NIR01029.1 HD domain-containing protein [Gemmatimonadales bacterium]NIS65108.1 HD domain-containing protein [Gemmatimonadales bacterium]